MHQKKKKGDWIVQNLPNLTSEVMLPRAWRSPIVPQALPTVCFIKYTLLLYSYTRKTHENPIQGFHLNNQLYTKYATQIS